MTEDQSTAGTGTSPEKAPLWKRLLPMIGGLVIVVILFGWVLPQFIDYQAVFRAIGKINGLEWAILVVAAVIRIVPEGWIYVAAQPGLSMSQGVQLFTVSETLSNVPPGGLDIISRYQMARSWGFPPSESTSATIASWVFTTIGKLALPIAAVFLLAVDRVQNDDLDLLAIIAFGLVAVGGVVLYLVLRSENLAGRVGDVLGAGIRWSAGLFRREVKTDFRNLVQEFRTQAADVLRRRTPLGLTAGITARLAAFVVLLLSIRFVGIGQDQLSWTVAFGAFAVVAALSVIPLLSIPGVTEVVLISVFNQATGGSSPDEVAAAVFVYRILTWLMPIPFGGVAFTRWRDRVRASGDTDLLDSFEDSGTSEAGG